MNWTYFWKWKFVLFIFTAGTNNINKRFSRKSRICGLYISDSQISWFIQAEKTFKERKLGSSQNLWKRPGWLCVQRQKWNHNKNWLKLCHSTYLLNMVPPVLWAVSNNSQELPPQPWRRSPLLQQCSLLRIAAFATPPGVILPFLFPCVSRSNFEIQTHEPNCPGQVIKSFITTMRFGKMSIYSFYLL